MMETAETVFSQLDAYIKARGLSRRELADKLDIPYSTVKKWFTKGKSKRNPSKEHLNGIKVFLENEERPEVYRQLEETKHRAEKIKYLLLLLEDELRWFRDGNTDAREVFRKELDASDIGYISSLLTMLSDEDKFNRWLTLTTMRFQSFRRK